MRVLIQNEINQVAGRGYQEDIITAAASIYVGTTIGRVATTVTGMAFSGAAGWGGALSPTLEEVIQTLGDIVTPVMFFAAPLLLVESLYPGMIYEKVEPYLA